MQKIVLLLSVLLMTTACSNQVLKPEPISCDCSIIAPIPKENSAEEKPKSLEQIPPYALLKLASWEDLDGLLQDDLVAAWPAWMQSCTRLIKKDVWKSACETAQTIKPKNATIVNYLAEYFDVYQANNVDGSTTGLITGYYQPLLNGSRTPSEKYPYPLYQEPKDLITVELADAYPELKYKRIRGRLEGKKLVPYRARAD